MIYSRCFIVLFLSSLLLTASKDEIDSTAKKSLEWHRYTFYASLLASNVSYSNSLLTIHKAVESLTLDSESSAFVHHCPYIVQSGESCESQSCHHILSAYFAQSNYIILNQRHSIVFSSQEALQKAYKSIHHAVNDHVPLFPNGKYSTTFALKQITVPMKKNSETIA